MDIDVYVGNVSKYLEGEYFEELRNWKIGVINSKRLSDQAEKKIWQWKQQVSKSGRVKEGGIRK